MLKLKNLVTASQAKLTERYAYRKGNEKDHGILSDEDIHKRYTVMLAMYMKDKNSKPLYFYGDEYGELYPSDKRIKAIIGGGPKPNHSVAFDVDLQYYVIANKPNWECGSKIWTELKNLSGHQAQ